VFAGEGGKKRSSLGKLNFGNQKVSTSVHRRSQEQRGNTLQMQDKHLVSGGRHVPQGKGCSQGRPQRVGEGASKGWKSFQKLGKGPRRGEETGGEGGTG